MLPVLPPAVLALADGTVFRGTSIGAAGRTVGEVVFNTALTGYQEILTDPSYCQQIVTLTYPHIGSYGVNEEDVEAKKVFAAGLVIKDLPIRMSNFRAGLTLSAYLQREGTVAIADVDTRQLTRRLRTQGAQNGCIVAFPVGTKVGADEVAAAVAAARGAPSMSGLDLAKVVSAREPYPWTETEWQLGSGYGVQNAPRFHVVAYDFGVKRNILRMLASRGCRITVVPAQASAADVMALRPDGVFLSNGPGDPEPCDYAIAATRTLIDRGLPTFGICLGHQIMASGVGGEARFKMKFGHHGANHPVKDLDNGRVLDHQPEPRVCGRREDASRQRCAPRTSACSTARCRASRAPTDRPSAFRGIRRQSPGPHDIGYLFDRFTGLMEQKK